ncbi:MAG: hypothetical protein K2O31_05275 [Clostridia bacterium]|nr:hypothetical protein [Clostridia bacterium]
MTLKVAQGDVRLLSLTLATSSHLLARYAVATLLTLERSGMEKSNHYSP